MKPRGIKPTHATITCYPNNSLVGAAERPVRKLSGAPEEKVRPVGHVSYRGQDYQASLHFPNDMLQPLLLMLSTGKYRYVSFEAVKGSREAEIYSYYFVDKLDDD